MVSFKKIGKTSGIILIASMLATMPVLAHGHHGSGHHGQRQQVQVQQQPAEQPPQVQQEQPQVQEVPDNTPNIDTSCPVCTVEGCQIMGRHLHENVPYCGYAHESGYCDGSCGAVTVCNVEGCTETGHHLHDGVSYCGYAHQSGYCDGS